MSLRRLALLMALTVLGALGSRCGISRWSAGLEPRHPPQRDQLPAGGVAEYWFDVNNVGDTATSGPITLTVELPEGFTRNEVRQNTIRHLTAT